MDSPIPTEALHCQVSACLYSLIETAKANNLEPYKYLRYLFEKFPFISSETELAGLFVTPFSVYPHFPAEKTTARCRHASTSASSFRAIGDFRYRTAHKQTSNRAPPPVHRQKTSLCQPFSTKKQATHPGPKRQTKNGVHPFGGGG